MTRMTRSTPASDRQQKNVLVTPSSPSNQLGDAQETAATGVHCSIFKYLLWSELSTGSVALCGTRVQDLSTVTRLIVWYNIVQHNVTEWDLRQLGSLVAGGQIWNNEYQMYNMKMNNAFIGKVTSLISWTKNILKPAWFNFVFQKRLVIDFTSFTLNLKYKNLLSL